MGYEAVIFDLDGTLVHTAPEYRYQIVGQTLQDLGTTSSRHDIDRFWFEARRDAIIKECFGLEPEKFWEVYRKHDTMGLRRQFTRLYDDVGFIKELRRDGYKTGIVTGAPMHVASLEIGMLGEGDFDGVVIAQISNGIQPKPHPHGLESCLELLRVDKSKAVYVGNADEDVATAKNAQVYDVLLVRGEHDFPDVNPSLRIHSLYELRQLLGLRGANSD
ncbi:MAG TPA: HAD family hydrolase [Candidatus Nanoarchaeia archaeon]|nr:HAD family hydrolase [Candidatus Nanoarchaeia archaeon]